MGIVDIAVIKPHREICPQGYGTNKYETNKFEDIQTYLELARRSIMKFAPRYANYLLFSKC